MDEQLTSWFNCGKHGLPAREGWYNYQYCETFPPSKDHFLTDRVYVRPTQQVFEVHLKNGYVATYAIDNTDNWQGLSAPARRK